MLRFALPALSCLLLAATAAPAEAVEQAPYKTVQSDGDFEIRDYPRLVAARTVEKGGRDDVANDAFRRLADYIFEDDRPEGEIEMTAPVFMAPSGKRQTSMEFVMPRRWAKSSLPKPEDARVSIVNRSARRVAAIRFSGWADDEDLAEKEAELRAWMGKKGLRPAGKVEWAFYNPPWTLGPWRRNEVLIEIRR